MVYTKEFTLPTIEELTVPEVKLGTASLLAGANHLGLYCLTENDEFMLCKNEEHDPRKCINEGKAVTACSIEFFKKIRNTCVDEFQRYARCVDRSSKTLTLARCRKTQALFDQCVLDNLNIERPSHGYYCMPRIHDTKRPRPPEYVIPDFPNKPVPATPHDEGRERAKYGTREFFFN